MASALGSRPRARGRGRSTGAPMPGAPGKIDPGYSGPPLPGGKGVTGDGGTTTPKAPGRGRAPGRGGQGGGKRGIGGQALAGPGGRQLEAKVQAGKITGAQAKRTLGQREVLAKTLGPNWRDKLQVGGKSFAQVNAGLKKNPGNAKLAALRKKLVTNRASVLKAAQAKGGKKAATPKAKKEGE